MIFKCHERNLCDVISEKMTGHPMQNRILQRKEHYIKGLVAGLYRTEISKDFSQTNQFRELTGRSIQEYFYSSHKKGIDHHRVKTGSKYYLKDW